jgi:hypothetical protein
LKNNDAKVFASKIDEIDALPRNANKNRHTH